MRALRRVTPAPGCRKSLPKIPADRIFAPYNGGSFVWTPRHSHGRELAKLRGQGLFLKADVKLPVKALRLAQRAGVKDAVIAAGAKWQASSGSDPEFKAPPPGFVPGDR